MREERFDDPKSLEGQLVVDLMKKIDNDVCHAIHNGIPESTDYMTALACLTTVLARGISGIDGDVKIPPDIVEDMTKSFCNLLMTLTMNYRKNQDALADKPTGLQ